MCPGDALVSASGSALDSPVQHGTGCVTSGAVKAPPRPRHSGHSRNRHWGLAGDADAGRRLWRALGTRPRAGREGAAMSKDEDFSLEEKLAAMEMSLAEKKGARFDDLKRNLTETIVERRASEFVADPTKRGGKPGAIPGPDAPSSRSPMGPGMEGGAARMAPVMMPGATQPRSRAATSIDLASRGGRMRPAPVAPPANATGSSPLSPAGSGLPRTSTLAAPPGGPREGSLAYVHTLQVGERKGGWIKISGPPFLVKESEILSLQEVFNDIQGAAGEGVVTLQAFRRYVASRVPGAESGALRERARILSADLYRVLDREGKESVDFIDIVRVMHPELSKRDLAIVVASVMPPRDIRVLDEDERREISRAFEEKTFKSEGKLPVYQVLVVVRDRVSPQKMSEVQAILRRQGVTESAEVTVTDFLNMVNVEEERLRAIEASITPEERIARYVAEKAEKAGMGAGADADGGAPRQANDIGAILQQYTERRVRAETMATVADASRAGGRK